MEYQKKIKSKTKNRDKRMRKLGQYYSTEFARAMILRE